MNSGEGTQTPLQTGTCLIRRNAQSNGMQVWLNSLTPGKFEWYFRYVIFKSILVIDCSGISCEIALIWMSLDFTDDQSTLVQVMAWCHQATSHYLSQWWPRFLSPYGVTRPEWVNTLRPGMMAATLADDIFKCISLKENLWIKKK